MTRTASPPRPIAPHPSLNGRGLGYAIAAAVNGILLYFVNVDPGWRTVPVLTADAASLIGLLNVSLVLGVLVNLIYPINDEPWFKSFGDLVTTGVSLVLIVRLLQVFPFAMTADPVDWPLIVRSVLITAAVGSAIAMLVQFMTLIRARSRRPRRPRPERM